MPTTYTRKDDFEDHLTRYLSALESGPDEVDPETARTIGLILGMFGAVEIYVPKALSRLSGIPLEDAKAIVGAFRAFSNKIGLIEEFISQRGGTPETKIASYVKGRFNDANKIRNLYAHGIYRWYGELLIDPYGDRNRTKLLKMVDLKNDLETMRRISLEMNSIYDLGQIPPALFAQL